MDIVQGIDAITVHLTRPHAAAARAFYSSVLGLRELSWDDAQGRGEWEVPGGTHIVAHVMQPHEPGRAPGTVTGVMFGTPDVHAVADEIKKRGVDEPWKAPWGPQYTTAADPDGNEWLFIQRSSRVISDKVRETTRVEP